MRRPTTRCQHHEQIGVELTREQLRAQVLVDDGFHADELTVRALLVHRRNASAAGADDDGAMLEKPAYRSNLEDALR